jgi:hypothetical protein
MALSPPQIAAERATVYAPIGSAQVVQAGPVEDEKFHPVGPFGPKDEDVTLERVGLQRLLH